MQITDDDLVPLNLLDFIVAQIETKMTGKSETIKKLIKECEDDVKKK